MGPAYWKEEEKCKHTKETSMKTQSERNKSHTTLPTAKKRNNDEKEEKKGFLSQNDKNRQTSKACFSSLRVEGDRGAAAAAAKEEEEEEEIECSTEQH